MNARESKFRDKRGMASLALFIFAVVSVVMLVTNFNLNYAVNTTTDAYDAFASETVEKNGIAQIVKESILAIRETAIVDNNDTVENEINTRLGSMTFPSGVTVQLASSPAGGVPSHVFFPMGTPPAAAQPATFAPSTATRALVGSGALYNSSAPVGMGNLFNSLVLAGPCSDLGFSTGPLTYTFTRTAASQDDDRTYVVNANLFSVPLTNVDVVAYGLPTTPGGSIPAAAPAVPNGFFGPNVSRLVVTSNNPSNDPTAYPDLFGSASSQSGSELLPYQYRNAISFSWNAYDYLWSSTYQGALVGNASANSMIYNFASPPSTPPVGVTVNGPNSITIDCSAVPAGVGALGTQATIVAVVDPSGTGSVTVTGSPSGAAANGNPFVLVVQGTGGNPLTQVSFTGNNYRPAIFYLENSDAIFSGSPQVQGALFLDRYSTGSGAVTWFGHLSFYGPNSPLSTLGITMVDWPAVKTALADLAPRVLLVSATATR